MKGFVVAVSAALLAASAQSPPTQTPLAEFQTWGPSVSGLRIAFVASSRPVPPIDARFWVALHNTGDADVVVNLGFMLANGKVMFPSALRLLHTDPAGKTRELEFFDRRYPGVAGRVDDFTVALRAGGVYALPLSLDQYYSPSTREHGTALAPGRHRIAVRFNGTGANSVNGDMQGMALMHFWKGSVESGSLEFEVSDQMALSSWRAGVGRRAALVRPL